MSDKLLNGPSMALSHSIISGGTFNLHSDQQRFHSDKCGYDRLLAAVSPAALHDSGHDVETPKCHPNTRVAIIEQIVAWTLGLDIDLQNKFILWLSGAAGAGKSSIGRSVAELCAANGSLLASFFFGAMDSTRNHSRALVPTVVYQLCTSNPSIRESVETCITNDPLIFSRSLTTQFMTLVIDPLRKLGASSPTILPNLILLDGLDECTEGGGQSQKKILAAVLEVIKCSPIPLRFLICSRPENDITSCFNSTQMKNIVFRIFLGVQYSPDADIELYLRDSFDDIKASHVFKGSIPRTWPGENIINELVWKSSGQFIYAATVIRYIQSTRHRPDQRLESILGLRPSFKDLPFAQLDSVYSHILSKVDELSIVLDIIACSIMYEFSHTSTIEKILGLEPGSIQVLLCDLGSIITLYGDYPYQLIVLHHRSFKDFLLDSQRFTIPFSIMPMNIKHIIRLVHLFSQKHDGCRLLGKYASQHLLTEPFGLGFTFAANPSYFSQDLIHALSIFPMQGFLNSLLSHCEELRHGCLDIGFIKFFFKLISMQETGPVRELYLHHLNAYCQHSLSVLENLNSQDGESGSGMNFIYSYYHILPRYYPRFPKRIREFDLDRLYSAAPTMVGYSAYSILSPKGLHSPHISRIARSLFDYARGKKILALAAIFCFEFISDERRTKEEAFQILDIGEVKKHQRRNFPWRWRKIMYPNRFIINKRQMVLRGHNHCYRLLRLERAVLEYHDDHGSLVHHDTMFSIPKYREFRAKRWSRACLWPVYMFLLETFAYVLPLAGRNKRLIQMLQRNVLGSMSQLSPRLSKHARQVIQHYLDDMTRLEQIS